MRQPSQESPGFIRGEDSSKDLIERAAIEGIAIPALCGKVWKPSRNPEKYPICKTCQEILDQHFPQD
ncbi:MAG: DUF3039 domain-containing protein [Micrococcaceae bacterium]|nr:DUF3039 domain-containing protein [Micrococcaceae bacterium]